MPFAPLVGIASVASVRSDVTGIGNVIDDQKRIAPRGAKAPNPWKPLLSRTLRYVGPWNPAPLSGNEVSRPDLAFSRTFRNVSGSP